MRLSTIAAIAGVSAAVAIGGIYALCNLQTVPAGYVGVKVNLYGSDKGVQQEELGVGRYLLTGNEQAYLFPTFNQLHTYKVPFTFQTSDAMAVNAMIGVEYQVKPSMATKVFQTYRKGVEEITDVNLRQNVSDALIKYASLMDVNELTANGKSKLLDHVTEELRHQLEDVGIHIIRVSWASDIEYPPQVRESINAKIEATQRAMLRENEVAQSKAEAENVTSNTAYNGIGVKVKGSDVVIMFATIPGSHKFSEFSIGLKDWEVLKMAVQNVVRSKQKNVDHQ